ncbi:MAG: xanthine dehydrogenase family protein molybdopterin-binding subunit [Acidobacteria bacterium]|nr:xanthine dehydrogenase family protein molybdopterin-binding subunit [Acidobacteriota bacterium]
MKPARRTFLKMTPDARTALAQAGFTRRGFLKSSGALVVMFSTASLAERVGFAQGGPGGTPSGVPADRLDSWIAIGADGRVTAYTGKCELGQGLFTAQTQLVAEELSVPLSRVTLMQCDTSVSPDQGTTSGAQSHPTNFNAGGLALAAASAREALVKLSAARLNVPVEQLTAVDGVVSARGDASRRVSYGELVGGRTFEISVDKNAKRKPSSEWTVLGRPVPRLDIPGLVTAEAEFVHNVRVPGMLHGAVVRPPAVGATLASIDESSVKALPGVVRVVRKNNFVGVVAEKPWQAIQAAARLAVMWSGGTGLPDQRGSYDFLRTQPSRDTIVVDSGDVEATLASAASVIKATYLHPYQMHGSVGSSCAVADVRSDGITVWAASQNVHALRGTTALVLGRMRDEVRVIFTRGSGCYGINGADTVAFDAALMSQAAGKPVRVQLSRKDEMAWENYGLPFVIDQRVGVDSAGTIIAWDYEGWSAARGGRPGAGNPGNVATGFLAGFQPAAFAPRTPAPAPTAFVPDNNSAPSYVRGRVGGRDGNVGSVTSERAISHRVLSPFFTGPLRAPERLQNTFAHESFLDEVAAHVKADPVAYRLRHLTDARLMEVIRTAAKGIGWETRPSPRPARRGNVANGRGIASVACEVDNSHVALAAEVDVNVSTGVVTVKRMVICADCGPISNPDGLRNQLEGGALHGMSRTLLEEVMWDGQKVTSVDWRTYPSIPVGGSIPKVETYLINQPDGKAMGAGETSIPVAAAAIGNAIFDATGVRLRQIPFTPERVRAAFAART